MDLNHIQLPAAVLAELYPESLVEGGGNNPVILPAAVAGTAPVPPNQLKWLGENNKKVLVLVHYDTAVYLPDQQLQFLTAMLTACKLGLADIALVNTYTGTNDYKKILGQLHSRTALLFNIEPAAIGLPINFPFFQVQTFANCSFLYAPSLEELETDKVQKSKLWVSLRKLFNI